MPETLTTAIAAEIAGEAFKFIAPGVLERAKSLFIGKRLMVVGPTFAGKSSFLEYCQTGTLPIEGEPPRTLDVQTGIKFLVKIGKDVQLELRIKKAVDVPGQYSHARQAELVLEHKPHVLLTIVDVNQRNQFAFEAKPESWLDQFLQDLVARLPDNIVVKNQLSFVFALNKVDRLKARFSKKADDELTKRINELRALCLHRLRTIYGSRARFFPVTGSVLVDTSEGLSYAKQLVKVVARALRRNK